MGRYRSTETSAIHSGVMGNSRFARERFHTFQIGSTTMTRLNHAGTSAASSARTKAMAEPYQAIRRESPSSSYISSITSGNNPCASSTS